MSKSREIESQPAGAYAGGGGGGSTSCTLRDPTINHSLPHLRPEMSKSREIESQPAGAYAGGGGGSRCLETPQTLLLLIFILLRKAKRAMVPNSMEANFKRERGGGGEGGR